MNEKLKNVLKNSKTLVMTYDKTREFYYKYLISDEKLIRKRFKESR